jgi:hypothetical protein
MAPSFLTSALVTSEQSASRLSCFTFWERAPFTHRIKDWVQPRTGLKAVEKKKKSYTIGNRTPIIQSLARHCTDWSIATPYCWYNRRKQILITSFLKYTSDYFPIILTINPELTKSFFTFIMWRKHGFAVSITFYPLPHLRKHFDEPYPLSAAPFVFLSVCVRKHVNSHLIGSKRAPPPPPPHPLPRRGWYAGK